jgi:ribulose-5-phosphate 4-epimerase/fuculose-1-phosphate aldolase
MNNHDELRLQIATGVRMLVRSDLLDMNGHLSCRVPDTDHILINSRRASRAALTAKDVVRIDLDGNLVEGDSEPPSEFHIHTAVYRKRPEVQAALHHHPHWQTVLGIARRPMQPVFSIGSFIDPTLPVYEVSSLINTREIGEEMAEAMGSADVITIRHHGSVVLGTTVQEVFARAVFVEENAKKQYYAELLGPVQPMTGENLKRSRETNWKPIIGKKVWDYYEERARIEGGLDGIA